MHGRLGEEDLPPLRVELAHHSEGLARRQRLRALQSGTQHRVADDQVELLHASDVEERRRVGGVEDLVAPLRELVEDAVSVALRLRSEKRRVGKEWVRLVRSRV